VLTTPAGLQQLARDRAGRPINVDSISFLPGFGCFGLSSPSTSAASARMPPSPLLSARSTNTRYFTQTTSISAQHISDSTPSTFSRFGGTACAEPSRPF
jgi:hypothetical protein